MEMKPMENRILVLAKTNPFVPEKTKTGIIKPKAAFSKESGKIEEVEDNTLYGEIIEIGPEVKTLKIGDHIYFSRFAGYTVPLYEKDIIVLREGDVIVKFDGEEKDIL